MSRFIAASATSLAAANKFAEETITATKIHSGLCLALICSSRISTMLPERDASRGIPSSGLGNRAQRAELLQYPCVERRREFCPDAGCNHRQSEGCLPG